MLDHSAPSFDPAAELAEVGRATESLISTATQLSDEAVHGPSLLPGWSRGHVLAHVARNADGLVNLLAWGRTGRRTPMYPSTEERESDINTGAARALPELIEDLRDSAGRFAVAVGEMPPDAWGTRVRIGVDAAGPEIAASRVLWQRLKELEIHHVDLDAGYTPAHWPADFVSRALAQTCRMFSRNPEVASFDIQATDTQQLYRVGEPGTSPTISGSEAALLAWLTGRSNGDGLSQEPAGELPTIPPWA